MAHTAHSARLLVRALAALVLMVCGPVHAEAVTAEDVGCAQFYAPDAWSGLTVAQVRARYPDQYADWSDDELEAALRARAGARAASRGAAIEAYLRGDYAAAVRGFRQLAEQGDAPKGPDIR